eukprot:2320730-Rhodomonas_salina.1
MVMSGSLGSILTRGDEHYNIDGEGDAVLIGQMSIAGSLLVEGDSEVGIARASQARSEYRGWDLRSAGGQSQTRINSEIAGDFPMTFRGKFKAVDVDEGTTLVVMEGQGARKLLLPDVSGTIVTTGNLPPMVEDMIGSGAQIFHNVRFEGPPRAEEERAAPDSERASARGRQIVFGGGEKQVEVEINAVVRIRGGLAFEGEVEDGRRTTLEVEEPSGNNVLTLPDADGMVLTTGSLPTILDDVTILGALSVMEEVRMGAQAGDTVRFGGGGRGGRGGGGQKASMQHSAVRGRFPLTFSATATPLSSRDTD